MDTDIPLLQVSGLRVAFEGRRGQAMVLNGVDFELHAGETLCVVGESGCGKSMTALALLRLIPSPPGRITAGQVRFQGEDLVAAGEARMRQVRGNRISMIFQEPMTSLNPVFTVGQQIAEPLRLHAGLDAAAARQRAVEMLRQVGIPAPERRVHEYPHQLSGRCEQELSAPAHPYTRGLIACLPELGSSQAGGRTELPEIPGVVPSIRELGSGCAFRARCREAQPRCASEAPPLVALQEPSHGVACWLHAPASRVRAHTEALA
jgi:oligopeptide/dipeptide ABC transporter ATP-binding protein